MSSSEVTKRFEQCAAKWEWRYDNHSNYEGQSWDWYYSAQYDFQRSQHVILARRPDTSVVVAVHFDSTSPHEIGRAVFSEESDLEALMGEIQAYVAAQNFVSTLSGRVKKKAWWNFSMKIFLLACAIVMALAQHVLASDCASKGEPALQRVKSWHNLRVWHDRYPKCDDGDIADLLSVIIVDMLTTEWPTVPALQAEIRVRPTFQRFVVEHVDATANSDDLNTAIRNEESRCPRRSASLCKMLRLAATDALQPRHASQ